MKVLVLSDVKRLAVTHERNKTSFSFHSSGVNWLLIRRYSLLMELNDGIGQDVAHIDSSALLQHFGMLLQHQPADVGEEEAAIGVVRIGIGLRVFVVDSVVADPVVKRVLKMKFMRNRD